MSGLLVVNLRKEDSDDNIPFKGEEIYWLEMMRMLILSRLMTWINECGRLHNRNKAMLSLKANL